VLTDVKSQTKIVWFQQFSESYWICHSTYVIRQSVPCGRSRMWESSLAELDA